MRILQTVCLLALTISLAACDKQIQKFVEGAVPKKNDEPQSSSPVGIKISPGHMESTATGMAMEATITPTNQVMKSADVSAKVGISRTRVTQ